LLASENVSLQKLHHAVEKTNAFRTSSADVEALDSHEGQHLVSKFINVYHEVFSTLSTFHFLGVQVMQTARTGFNAAVVIR